jgi:hypothetical protein
MTELLAPGGSMEIRFGGGHLPPSEASPQERCAGKARARSDSAGTRGRDTAMRVPQAGRSGP